MSPFDLDRIHDVPDPLSDLGDELGARPLPPLRAAVMASPTRSNVANLRAFALGAALVYEFMWLVIMHKRADLHTLGAVKLLLEASIPIGAAVLAFTAAAAPGERGLGEPKARLATLVILAPALFVAATVALSSVTPVGEMDTGSFWVHCLRCFAWTSLYSAGPMVFAGWAFRRSFVVAPAWRTAALAIGCAAMGAATMTFVCSVGTPAHVLIGHGGAMFVGAIAGAFAGRRFGQV
jgi:hypothetical protein